MTDGTGEPDRITEWLVPAEWARVAARSHVRELYRRPELVAGLALAIVGVLVAVAVLYKVGVAIAAAVVGIPLAIAVASPLRRAKVGRELARRQPSGARLTLVERADRLELTDASGTHVFPYAEVLGLRPGEHLAMLLRRSVTKGFELIPSPLLSHESIARINRAVRGG